VNRKDPKTIPQEQPPSCHPTEKETAKRGRSSSAKQRGWRGKGDQGKILLPQGVGDEEFEVKNRGTGGITKKNLEESGKGGGVKIRQGGKTSE